MAGILGRLMKLFVAWSTQVTKRQRRFDSLRKHVHNLVSLQLRSFRNETKQLQTQSVAESRFL
mgnify:CR=1 FL=1